jgi:hypothetical protein
VSKRMMLDSGAFSVWNKGHTIDLEEYIAFCVAHPDTSYFVNLDVIPGKVNQKRSLTKLACEEACAGGWANYQRMLKDLPKDKVVPVYHQNDDVRWLGRYLDFGTPYIGISPANDSTTREKLNWMKPLRRLLFDGAGRPVVKTHGFAVTARALLGAWHWHSVDSASWKQTASWGGIYVPQRTNAIDDYAKREIQMPVSPASPTKKFKFKHYDSCGPIFQRRVRMYLNSIDLCMGESEFVKVDASYKLQFSTKHGVNPGEGESWLSKKDRVVLRPTIVGVTNSFRERCIANVKYVEQMAKCVSVDHVYLAGAPMPYPLEYQIQNRLLSFHEVSRGGGVGCFERHLELLES